MIEVTRLRLFWHNVRAFYQSTPTNAHWIGWLTLAAWVIKAVWLDEIPAPFRWFSAVSGVVDGVFSAIVAGYIFYIIFALLPDYQSRGFLAKFILLKMSHIAGDCAAILNEIGRVSERNLVFRTAQSEELVAAFSDVSMNKPPNMVQRVGTSFVPSTWMQFFMYHQERSKKAIADLFEQSRFLDAELISILTEINGCLFFISVAGIPQELITNGVLSAWEPGFEHYLGSCRKLARWHDAHRSPDTNQVLKD